MNNPEKVFILMVDDKIESLWYNEENIREEYQIQSDDHVVHPFLHEKLEKMQQNSAFWRNPVIAWLWIHIPDILGAIVLVLIGFAIWFGASVLWNWYQSFNS